MEAWQGILSERSVAAMPECHYLTVGNYHIDAEGKRLYAREIKHGLEEDGVTL